MFRRKSNVGRPPSRRDFLATLLAAPLATADDTKFLRSLAFVGRDDNLQSRLSADALRPQFHLLPAKNWMNDPNGPIFWNGMYHMFFQYNPNAAVWGDMHWAHAVSPDMIHWKHLPIALAPTPGWDDADGCFTGSAVDDHGTATFLYTGVKKSTPEMATLRDGHSNLREVQCLATSSDPELRSWTKWKTPVIEPPADPLLTGFRDPFLWRVGDRWYLGVGSGMQKQGGRVLLYRSKDLRQWEYLHPLATGKWTERENINPVDSGEMWECPDFFPLGSKHVLLYSTAGKVAWETGELDPKELLFHPQRNGVLDHGAYYAQKTQLDGKGNRILWGWIPERRPDSELIAAGWAGCMALPRVLSLDQQGDLQMHVAPETNSLRPDKKFSFSPNSSTEQRSLALQSLELKDLCGELRWTASAGPCSLNLDDSAGPWWSLNLAPAVTGFALQINDQSLQVPPPSGASWHFHLFLDASVAEFFCNDLHVVTSRIYRKPAGPLHVRTAGLDLKSQSHFEAWQLRPISRNRLTT
jgi:beta-fructofuranosidase